MFRLQEVVSDGCDGVVYRATRACDGLPAAVKVVRRERGRHEEDMLAVVGTHPRVVPFLGATMLGADRALAFEWFPGDVVDAVERAGGRLPEARAASIVRDVAHALRHVHGCGVVHCDVKADNVLLDAAGRACLADFGSAQLARGAAGLLVAVRGGTRAYMAPEMYEQQQVDGEKTDVWALGAMGCACVTGRMVTVHTGQPSVVLFPEELDGGGVSAAAASWVRWACCPNPGGRPTMAQLLQHEWLRPPDT